MSFQSLVTFFVVARNRWLEPAYKQHTAVDDKVGVILDVEVTTGQKNEGEMIEPQVDEVQVTTGIAIKMVTADAGYCALEKRGIDALIRPRRSQSSPGCHCAASGTMPSTTF